MSLQKCQRKTMLFYRWIIVEFFWKLEAIQFYKDNKITVIDWSPYSPDLNFTENLCALIKVKLWYILKKSKISWIQILLHLRRNFRWSD